jgi:hypothetical protein
MNGTSFILFFSIYDLGLLHSSFIILIVEERKLYRFFGFLAVISNSTR